MRDLRFIQRVVTSGVIATTAAFGSFVAEVQAATFTLPIEAAAKATGVDVLRDRYGLDGTGITIGVISDSFSTATTFDTSGKLDTYATNIANGYLPSGVNVLKDFSDPNASDEGRAIAQLIHAVAPGAKLMFHTGVGSVNVFGESIQALTAAGANIIVDDVRYNPQDIPDVPLDFIDQEPPNGPINQAINTVFNQGISYFTDAGNNFPEIPIYGHANNANALTVGAVYYGNAESYSNNAYGVVVEQGELEPFSSEGNPNSLKTDVVAPDGLPISFNLGGNAPNIGDPEFFDFFGTSAAAPYTAAVAALLLQADPSATPTEVYNALRETADSPASGFNSRLGFGLIRGDKAIASLNLQPEPVPEPSAVPVFLVASVLIVGLTLKRTQRKSKIIVQPSRSLALVHSGCTQLSEEPLPDV
ncbi:MAG: S8 family serine peptidase [Mojavia pulchra JT2-VF2]|jgi:subtilisin family serine protease|uniref:S8 family serine peptidase n=1 Tax=Mojavia pulchra JT2-VF2 TaxID=287848 RepID=A0A951Q1Q2_9NOST|nr:S8 family serine peptidase [Mojavia pulchra JT2-VF2]